MGLAAIPRWLRPWAPLLVGGVLRLGAFVANANYCHGDVNVDAEGAEALAAGRGFTLPWEEGTITYPDPLPQTPEEFGHPFDSHGPMVPLLAVPFVWITGNGYRALQCVSFACGLLLIAAAGRLARRFAAPDAAERAGEYAAWICALTIALIDYSGNGALYMPLALVMLAIPLVAGGFDSMPRTIGAGALLGCAYLIAYQSALLIPIFVLAAVRARGMRGSIVPLLAAGGACLAVALPWFVRNYAVFGDPVFSTNPVFFASKTGNMTVDLTATRPTLRIEELPGQTWQAMKDWLRFNSTLAVAGFLRTFPLLVFFSLGGLQRVLAARTTPAARATATLLVGGMLASYATAIICPELKTRHFVPMVPVLAIAAAVELAAGARVLWALVCGAGIAACYEWGGGNWYYPIQIDAKLQLPLAGILLLAILTPRFRRFVPWLAIVAFTIPMGVRAVASTSRDWNQFVYGNAPAMRDAWVPTSTFYETLTDPWLEGIVRGRQNDTHGAVIRLRRSGCKKIYCDANVGAAWNGPFVSCRGRAEIPHLGAIADFFGVDGIVMPLPYFERETMAAWLTEKKAELAYIGRDFAAYRVPRAP